MRWTATVVLAGWGLLIATANVRADGKFYLREKVPLSLPYQRAMLLHHGNTETLIVQSKYDLSQTADVNAIGWVVPVPTVPEIAGMDGEDVHYRFLELSMDTQPHIWHSRDIFATLAFLAFVAAYSWLVICTARWVFSSVFRIGQGVSRKQVRASLVATFAIALFIFVIALTTPLSGGLGQRDVEVIKVQSAGIYDTTVIRADAPGPIMDWLAAAGFRFDDSDKAVFADYVARGWCFVAAKVRPGVKARAIAGLADPLVLTFATDKPIYPLALTATAGAKTEILLYTISDTRLTCRGRLKLLCATPIEGKAASGLFSVRIAASGESERPRYRPLMDVPNEMLTLCKFKGTMTAAQMTRDLVFEPAANNKPYRSHYLVP